MHDTAALEDTGLTKNEIAVYLALLRLGESGVSRIAEHSGLYRPYVYDTLDRLSEKGLVSSLAREGKKLFRASRPRALLDIQRGRLEALEKTMPHLEALEAAPKEEASARLHSGRSVVRTIQQDVVRTLQSSGAESLVMGVDEQLFKDTDPIVMEQFFARMRRHNLKERVIVRENETFLPGGPDTTQYRALPEEYFDPSATFIYGETVALLVFSEPVHGVIIRSSKLAWAYAKQFELIWKVARPVGNAKEQSLKLK